jgi:hypothetical protein
MTVFEVKELSVYAVCRFLRDLLTAPLDNTRKCSRRDSRLGRRSRSSSSQNPQIAFCRARYNYSAIPNLGLQIPLSSRTIKAYVVRIGREQFLPLKPVTSRSTSESLQRKLNNQRNT